MSTLIVVDQAPYGSWAGREALDMTLSLAAFDQPAALLFTGAGVNWLRKHQAPEEIGQKSVEKNLAAAPIFGVEEILADATACQRYGLTEDNMIAGASMVADTSATLNSHQQVVFAG
ncbi:MAG: DsrE family protein [Pseudomonadota bacterium]|nr:DsrE family protein [Marinobacter sp.]